MPDSKAVLGVLLLSVGLGVGFHKGPHQVHLAARLAGPVQGTEEHAQGRHIPRERCDLCSPQPCPPQGWSDHLCLAEPTPPRPPGST